MYFVNFRWLIENCIILIEPVGNFEPVVAVAAIAQFKHLLDETPHRIHVVLNMSRVRTAVKNPRVVGSSLNRLRCHPNLCRMIFITSNPISRIGSQLLGCFLGVNFSVVATLDQALLVLDTAVQR